MREEEGWGGAEGGGRDVTSIGERIRIRNLELDVKLGRQWDSNIILNSYAFYSLHRNPNNFGKKSPRAAETQLSKNARPPHTIEVGLPLPSFP